METSNNIEFRSKFTSVITEQNRELLISSFQSFLMMDEKEALQILWPLEYLRDHEYLKSVFEKLGLQPDMMSGDEIGKLRNELRYQYQRKNPDFLKPNADSTEVEGAFEKLENKTDAIVAYIVYEYCIYCINRCDCDRSLYLLEQSEENNYFGGIRSMNFSAMEADYLKPYHNEIAELLRAVKNNQVDNELFNQQNDDADEADLEEEADFQDEPNGEDGSDEGYYTPAYPEDILGDYEDFEDLLISIDNIEELGYDIKEVFGKIDLIRELLNIARLLKE